MLGLRDLTSVDRRTVDTMETDPVLLWLLRHAGEEWGPLGVAMAAIDLTDRDAVLQRLQDDEPSTEPTEPAEPDEPPPIEDPEEPTVPVDPLPQSVTIGGGAAHPVAGFDDRRLADELVVYTPTSGSVSPANEWGCEVVVDGSNRITEVRDREKTKQAGAPIPPDGYVLSGHGAARRYLLKAATVGAPVRFGAEVVQPEPDPEVPTPPPPPVTPTPTDRPTGVPAGAKLILRADARTGKIAPLALETAGGPGRVKFNGEWFDVSLHPGDMASGIKSRTELKAYPTHTKGLPTKGILDGHHVVTFRQRFPKGYVAKTAKTKRGEVIVLQLHGPNQDGRYQGPPLSMRTDGNKLEIVHQDYKNNNWQPGPIHTETIQEGVAVDWALETIFDTKNGLFRIWRNDKMIKEVRGYTFNKSLRRFIGPKWGVYDVVYDVVTIQYADMCIWKVA